MEAQSMLEEIQDGDNEDKTKVFQVQYTDMKQFMTQLLARKRRRKKTDVEEWNKYMKKSHIKFVYFKSLRLKDKERKP